MNCSKCGSEMKKGTTLNDGKFVIYYCPNCKNTKIKEN